MSLRSIMIIIVTITVVLAAVFALKPTDNTVNEDKPGNSVQKPSDNTSTESPGEFKNTAMRLDSELRQANIEYEGLGANHKTNVTDYTVVDDEKLTLSSEGDVYQDNSIQVTCTNSLSEYLTYEQELVFEGSVTNVLIFDSL